MEFWLGFNFVVSYILEKQNQKADLFNNCLNNIKSDNNDNS